jgi:O-antigen/teichoic acid export membrane protein
MRRSRKFLVNVVSNVVNSGTGALFALVLPYFLVRLFTPPEFSLWVLVLQLAAYVNYLNFGLQTAIGRYVSHAEARDDVEEVKTSIAAGVQILTLLALIGLLLVIALAVALPDIFRQIGPALIGPGRAAVLWVGASMALALPFSALLAVFVGLQRNEIPAVVTLIGRGSTAAATIVAAFMTRALVPTAAAYFCGMVFFCVLQGIVFFCAVPQFRPQFFRLSPVMLREMMQYCISLTIWSLGMFLITGLDTTIVGIFDFKAVAAYGTAASAVLLVTGVIGAVLRPLIQIFAQLHARAQFAQLFRLLNFSSKAFLTVMIAMGAWMIGLAHIVFPLWLGHRIGTIGVPVFDLLVLANIIRNIAGVYAVYLVATGQQRYVTVSPIAEGIINLATSIAGAYYIGALGVALGTVIGAVVGVAAHYLYNLPRTVPETFSKARFYDESLFLPCLYDSPLIAAAIACTLWQFPFPWAVALLAVATLPVLLVGRRFWSEIEDWRSADGTFASEPAADSV